MTTPALFQAASARVSVSGNQLPDLVHSKHRRSVPPSLCAAHSESAARSLWLEVRWEGNVRVFELGPADERALVVGSLLHSDIRIPRPAVSPVHFHFEREGDALCIIPAYGLDVRVNTALVRRPRRLSHFAILEFAGLHLEAIVHSGKPVWAQAETSPPLAPFKPDISYLRALPDCGDRTPLVLGHARHARLAEQALLDPTTVHSPEPPARSPGQLFAQPRTSREIFRRLQRLNLPWFHGVGHRAKSRRTAALVAVPTITAMAGILAVWLWHV